jgi:hypothetical protein
LLWAFPGEFHPLVPYRPDLYYPVGLLGKSIAEVLFYPRPVAYLFERSSGLLGIQGAIAATIAVVLATALLAPLVVSRISGAMPGPIAFLTYLILLFTHPEFYFHHRFDVPSVIAGFFVLLAILGANSTLAQPRRRSFVLTLACVAAMALAKETFDVSAPLIFAGLCALRWRPGLWRRAALLLGSTCAIEAAAEAFNMLRFSHYAGPISASSTYAPDFRVVSVLTTIGRYLHDLLPPMQLVIVVLALLAAAFGMRNRWRDLIAPAAFLLGGVLALLPNSFLPHHFESQYAWNGAQLLFAIVLFMPSAHKSGVLAQWFLAAAALYSVHANARIYASAPQQWLLNEEHANARIAQALPGIRSAAGGAGRLLVTGLTASYHPWEYPEFVREYFGPGRQWTFVVSRNAPEGKQPNVAMVRARGVRLEDYDGAVRFREDSGLQDVLVGAAYRDAVAHNPEAVLLPALSKQAQELASKPGDFMALLKMGTLALSSGLPERALPYLRRAAEAGPTNPYPWFFMGQALRDANDTGAARLAFEKAIALDGPNPNPAFRQSLSDLPPK